KLTFCDGTLPNGQSLNGGRSTAGRRSPREEFTGLTDLIEKPVDEAFRLDIDGADRRPHDIKCRASRYAHRKRPDKPALGYHVVEHAKLADCESEALLGRGKGQERRIEL